MRAEPAAEARSIEHAVILFVRDRGRILLIDKKRGLGAGKVNGPGGRVEAGETPAEAAVRETREEVGLEVRDPVEAAQLAFEFTDGLRLHVTVYLATTYGGTLVETDEAAPFWEDERAIPYDRMWADDRLWLPDVLAGRYVEGRFGFDDDSMLWSELSVRER